MRPSQVSSRLYIVGDEGEGIQTSEEEEEEEQVATAVEWTDANEEKTGMRTKDVLSVESRHVGELLCRNCGATITRQSELINVTALEQRYKYKYDFPVVGKTTTVHVFENPADETFHVLAAHSAHLKFRGQPSSEATWFPGMQWTVCVCSKCDHHMGWYFQPDKSSPQQSKQKSFVGLVLDYLISADYAETVTKVPI